MQTFPAKDLKNVYSPYHKPLGVVQPAETFVVETRDGFAGAFRKPEDLTPEKLAWAEERWCIVTGPIAVEGAEPNQVIALTIESVEPISPGIVVISRYEATSPTTGGKKMN